MPLILLIIFACDRGGGSSSNNILGKRLLIGLQLAFLIISAIFTIGYPGSKIKVKPEKR